MKSHIIGHIDVKGNTEVAGNNDRTRFLSVRSTSSKILGDLRTLEVVTRFLGCNLRDG